MSIYKKCYIKCRRLILKLPQLSLPASYKHMCVYGLALAQKAEECAPRVLSRPSEPLLACSHSSPGNQLCRAQA